jgi:hypothetical protein
LSREDSAADGVGIRARPGALLSLSMFRRKHQPEPALKVVATVSNEAEGAMVCDLLSQAGIGAVQKLTSGIGSGWSGSGAREVYVEEQNLARAREVLDPGSPD